MMVDIVFCPITLLSFLHGETEHQCFAMTNRHGGIPYRCAGPVFETNRVGPRVSSTPGDPAATWRQTDQSCSYPWGWAACSPEDHRGSLSLRHSACLHTTGGKRQTSNTVCWVDDAYSRNLTCAPVQCFCNCCRCELWLLVGLLSWLLHGKLTLCCLRRKPGEMFKAVDVESMPCHSMWRSDAILMHRWFL